MDTNKLYLGQVQIGNQTYDLKDIDNRADLAALQSALGSAAYLGVDSAVTSSGEGVVKGAAIKEYVDAQVGAIHKFDVVVAESLPTASADTMYKLYLIPKSGGSGTNVKEEWITVRSGQDPNYTYAWEKIGDTEVDLSAYLKTADAEAWKVAGVSFGSDHDVTAAEVSTALGLGALATKSSASGSYTPAGTIGQIDATPAGTVTLGDFTQTATSASLTKGDFTPAGTVSVQLAQTATNVSSTGKFTPAGTIAATSDGTVNALTGASFVADNAGVQIGGTNASSAVSFSGTSKQSVITGVSAAAVAPSFTEGAFTPAAFESGFYTAGSAATWTGATYSAPSLGNASTASFAIEGMVASVSSETLVLSNATISAAVTAQGTFSAGSVDFGTFNGGSATVIDTTKFSGGAKASDTFSAGSAATFSTGEVISGLGTATAAAQTFTGNKYGISVTSDTALKNVAFTGTEGNVEVSGNYDKASVSAATFSGTKAESVLVTGVSYDKATANGATFSGTSNKITPTFTGTAATITVE